MPPPNEASDGGPRQPHLAARLRLVIGLNLAYFGIEIFVALAIGSVALIADSVDFLEDATVNLLVLAGLRLAAHWRAKLGMGLAALLVLPAAAGIVMLIHKIGAPLPPKSLPLSVTGLGALIVNGTCAFLLAGVRSHAGSLTKAAFLSARNDTIANVAIILAGGVTWFWPTLWPDLAVGAGIALLNADSAREIFAAAREEHGRGG